MKHALVFGGSGQIGRPLLAGLLRGGWRVTAVSRQPQHDRPGLNWLHGDFAAMPALPARADAIVSCGPLDAFAHWYGTAMLDCDRVVAFGSTSVVVKRGSADARERDVAQRLRAGEEGVFAAATQRGAQATLLRPTLVYGAGRDATLTRIATLAQRWGRFPLPRNAIGLRQPVHVDDLAAAAVAALESTASHGQTYALPGGEALAYREMVRRVLAALEPSPALVELPSPLFNLALAAAKLAGGTGLGEAAVQRMRSDLVFDAAPAHRDLGYAPRAFRPTARMFDAREENEDEA
ncbi:NAD-dependent epimerase/dehydratase family protein [Lysobacter solisilvae (ex Woo and Kim 2020)]|uniref:NAD-dependent epimerase/dehydratase family protein n=1 Tax=Agrilutibacter terrestris TaxID=2865112 RepID=A0A7H0FZK1_9GAMM|nr:NAD-dependent epimerase/dehydratase family protein [Lysobacter terrestris]QNP41467.1 NAD-dependent epimerase/dehydratase family protein [Lysobacter terrestris]